MRWLHAVLFCFGVMISPCWPADRSAIQFVNRIYDNYGTKAHGVPLVGNAAAEVFDVSLIRLFKADQARSHGETGTFDYDPLCSCQDFDIKNVSVIEAGREKGKSVLKISFNNLGSETTLFLVLLETKAGWRVYDIRDSHVKSFRRLLSRSERP